MSKTMEQRGTVIECLPRIYKCILKLQSTLLQRPYEHEKQDNGGAIEAKST